MANRGPAFKFSFSLSTVFNFSMDFSKDQLTQSGKPKIKTKKPKHSEKNAYRNKIFLGKKLRKIKLEIVQLKALLIHQK